MSKTALIVDDSALARHVLSQLLAKHAVIADTAPSAEMALEYLRQNRPDVVFMDHMMPGMDGFEALEAIKANPATATIPVMIYTSQEGDLYIGQARALGAFGVLPKELKPVEVTKVLEALHLISTSEDQQTPGSIAAVTEDMSPTDSYQVKELLEELFHQQRSALRDEIRGGYQRMLVDAQPSEPTVSTVAPSKAYGKRMGVAASVLVLLAAMFGYLYFETNALLQQANDRVDQLISNTAELSALEAIPVEVDNSASLLSRDLQEILEWAINLNDTYQFNAVPLDDNRERVFGALLQYLRRTGFSGTVAIDVHVGKYCMDLAPDGTLQLAAPQLPVTECQQIGWPDSEAEAIGEQQSLAFANTVAVATRDYGIRTRIVSYGSTEPGLQYPVISSFLTAAEWNRIAASNHRISVRLLADTD